MAREGRGIMELLFGFLFELIFEILLAGVFGFFEYLFGKSGKRFWMWAFGLVAIALMIWWRGAHLWATYVLALGWLGMIIYIDRRMVDKDVPS
jgi:hypothetical protein